MSHAAPEPGQPSAAPTASPVRLEGHLETHLSRWLWLVKWLLLIPHYVVLFFLFIAALGVTLVAFFVILFTGRYPRGLFEFNVGVLRWAWRVGFYGYSALGTDRYPPFTIDRDPSYPASLEIAYPESLNNGLVLVKWLLVIPQGFILSVLLGSTVYVGDHVYRSPGLISLLVFFAGVCLLFTGHYLAGAFELVIGLNRWVLRVCAYLFLFTDRYPPFRLDQGGVEPVTDGIARPGAP
jgi:hypothetical protein